MCCPSQLQSLSTAFKRPHSSTELHQSFPIFCTISKIQFYDHQNSEKQQKAPEKQQKTSEKEKKWYPDDGEKVTITMS